MDWSDLPSDLLHLISKKLSDLSCFVRFRAVCSQWRVSAPASDPPLQLPWLLQHRRHPLRSMITLYSLPSDEIYCFRLPPAWLMADKEIHGTSHHYILGNDWKHLTGSSHHYFLTRDVHNRLSVFNPVTKTEIPLPLPHRFESQVSGTIQPFDYCHIHVFFDKGETVASRKSRNLHDLDYNEIEASRWTHGHISHKGKYFMIDFLGMMRIIDLVTGDTISSVPPPPSQSNFHWGLGFNYLVESSGELLSIFRSNFLCWRPESWCFKVYRLESGLELENYKWVEINDIGDAIIFLDDRTGISVKASHFIRTTKYKRNCIYFTQVQEYWFHYFKLCMYNIKDGTRKELDKSFGRSGTWFLPTLN